MDSSDRDRIAKTQASLQQTQWLSCDSAAELAPLFGRPILEPTWWPPDASPISWSADIGAAHHRYRIGAHRDDGSPIFVIGVVEAGWSGRSPRDWLQGVWSEPSALASVRGMIGRVGTPPSLHAVIYDEGLAVQLIGYRTDDEVTKAVESIRSVGDAAD